MCRRTWSYVTNIMLGLKVTEEGRQIQRIKLPFKCKPEKDKKSIEQMVKDKKTGYTPFTEKCLKPPTTLDG